MRKDIKLYKKRGYDLLKLYRVVELLRKRLPLDPSYRDHDLKGRWEGHRELHIQGDWLLVYQIFEDKLILRLCRTGTHSDLFKE